MEMAMPLSYRQGLLAVAALRLNSGLRLSPRYFSFLGGVCYPVWTAILSPVFFSALASQVPLIMSGVLCAHPSLNSAFLHVVS